MITHEGGSYHRGWITPPSSDGGADFVGRLDIGSGFSTAKIVVLGQAKCESLTSPTSGGHIARTVARLRRGWIGVYVTTSYYSQAVQREVIEDRYPIVLIHGLRVAEVVQQLMHEKGETSVEAFLERVDATYEDRVQRRQPKEILID